MAVINNETALQQTDLGLSVIIDVREPAEYNDHHLPNAINIPSSSFNIENFTAYQNKKIYLVCHSGNRANVVLKKLKEASFTNVFVLEEHMESLQNNFGSKTKGWSVDRQFRFTLGLLLFIFLIGYHFASTYFIIIPIILCTGLIVTAIIDRCYMRMGIAMLPWNKNKKE